MSASPVDPTRCPLCGGDNSCGMARGAGHCWCFATRVPEDVLGRVPAEQRDLACICERCASGASGEPTVAVAAEVDTDADQSAASHEQADRDVERPARER